MKKLLCNEIGGPSECTTELFGETIEEMGQNSHKHVMEMIEAGDIEHNKAMRRMKEMSPEEQQREFQSYQLTFEAAPDV